MAATMDFEVRMGSKQRASEEDGEDPMRILVLGDFRGDGVRPPLGERSPLLVDIDNFDGILARLAPRVQVPAPRDGPPIAIEFRELEDFHPDNLYQRLDLFRGLNDLRGRLEGVSGFSEACEELRSLVQGLPSDQGKSGASPPVAAGRGEDDGTTFERLLGKGERTVAAPSPRDPAALLVERLIAGHLGAAAVATQGRERQVYLKALDDLAGSWMRTVLHDPGFQALEAAWRSLHGLVSNVETGESLSVHVLDVTKKELAVDLEQAAGELSRSGCWRALGGPGADVPGSRRWSVLVGDYGFGTESGDAALLGALGALGSWAGCSVLAAADPGLFGCGSAAGLADPSGWAPLPAAWQELRRSEASQWVGLALPRVLLRLPYGPKRDAIESFALDEVDGEAEHGSFLWGNPAFGCARLLAEGYQADGWAMEPGDVQEIGDLPAFTFQLDGERQMLPCGEAWIGERAGQSLLAQGLMPILSHRDRNAVRLMRFQSLSDPSRALAGPWGP